MSGCTCDAVDGDHDRPGCGIYKAVPPRVAATFHPDNDAGTILRTVERLAASWHAARLDNDDFSVGRAAGYCFAISLLLGVPSSTVFAALEEKRL